MSSSCKLLLISSLALIGVVLMFKEDIPTLVLRHQLKKMTSATMVFPKEMVCVKKGAIIEDSILEGPRIPTLVIYIDSTQCGGCQMDKLYRYTSLYEQSMENKVFQLRIIISPKTREYWGLLNQIIAHQYVFPVYFDTQNRVKIENSFLSENTVYHSFLLDRENHPIMVGDPTASNKLYAVFLAALEQEINNGSN